MYMLKTISISLILFLIIGAASFGCCMEKNLCGSNNLQMLNECCSQPVSNIHAPCTCGQTLSSPSALSFEVKFTSELSFSPVSTLTVLSEENNRSISALHGGHERDPVLGSKINEDKFCRQFISKKDFV